MDLHVDGSGNLWVADWLNHRVLRFDNVAAKSDGASADGVLGQDALTTSLRMWKDNTDADSFVFPSGVCVDDDGVLWIADTGNSRILRFDRRSGAFLGNFSTGYPLSEPTKPHDLSPYIDTIAAINLMVHKLLYKCGTFCVKIFK